MKHNSLSIIISTFNENGNIYELVRRIDRALSGKNIIYEIIFVDDHSTDKIRDAVKYLSSEYPVYFFLKKGARGKTRSYLEGINYATYDIVAIMDADMSYPPEALPEMLEKNNGGLDIVVARRAGQPADWFKRIIDRFLSLFLKNIVYKISDNKHFGIKVFDKKIIDEIAPDPANWSFGSDFLVNARFYGYSIGIVDIYSRERYAGKTKIGFLKTACEVAAVSFRSQAKKISPIGIHPKKSFSMAGAGLACYKNRFITHTTLHHNFSAAETFVSWQRNLLIALAAVFLLGAVYYPIRSAVIFIAVLSAVYFVDMLFNFYLAMKSLDHSPEIKSEPWEIEALRDDCLPVYTILCPLYKEAHMLSGFIGAIGKIDWPKSKLNVLLLLEESDKETVASAEAMNLPYYIRIIKVPDSLPRTKPKACNYGMCFAKGKYTVIYDAEDIPDPLQLKKAYLGFQKVSSSVWCLQAKLSYFNSGQNLLTRLFTAEYSLWFDLVLPGLQSMNTSIPLGGTSNHFRTRDLLELRGWDPFNVTEDCDLGMRIFKKGYKTVIIDSVTLEEANSNLKNWLRQRSRWIKGYMQTYLVHMRHPVDFVRENGIHALIFQLVVGGKVAFIFINPVLWLATFFYFAINGTAGPVLAKLYPTTIFYLAASSLFFGNFLSIYYYMIACAKRKQWPLVKYVFFVPFYWALMSLASLTALYQLFVKPHFWEKTNHGLIPGKNQVQPVSDIQIAESVSIKEKAKGVLGRFIPGNALEFLFSGKGYFTLAVIFSSFLNFVFNAFLGRVLSFEALSLVTFVNILWYVVAIFFGAFSLTVNHRVAYLSASGNKAPGAFFWRSAVGKGFKIIIPLALVWLIAAPFLSGFFNIENYIVLSLFSPALVFAFVSSANSGFLNGNFYFFSAANVFLLESAAKLLFAGALFYLGKAEWIYASVFIAVIISSLASIVLARRKAAKSVQKEEFYFPKTFFGASVLTGISSALFLSLDIILVKHFLPQALAGEYMLLSLVGKMIYFFGSIPNMFMVSFVGRDIGLGKNPENIFKKIYMAVFVLTFSAVLVFGFWGEKTIPILFGEKSLIILPFVFPYAIAIALFTITNVIVTYNLARKNYYFAVFSFVFSLVMSGAIVISHSSVEKIVAAVYWVSVAGWISMEALNYLEKRGDMIKKSFGDLSGFVNEKVFQGGAESIGVKRILIFNWRDTRHKFAGGAEVYTQQIAKRWAAQGHWVTIFCGNDRNSPNSEMIDGVEIIRRGGFYLVYVWAFLYYIFRFRNKYDIIIDCQNGIPFFTPFYAKEPVYCLMHHVHQEVFRRSLSKPLSALARFLEKNLMPVAYRKIPFITVSESSRQGIEELGLGKAGIWVVNPGVDLNSFIPGKKSSVPLILYLGRLKAYKSIDVLIHAFSVLVNVEPGAVLVIAGSGEETKNLKKIASDLRLGSDKVRFMGEVSEKEKIRLLQEAWVLVNPSLMEGWGIVAIEASACRTPIVASDVPGLRDSVKKFETGYLVPYGDSEALAEHILKIIRNRTLRERMGFAARLWAENFDWQKSSNIFLELIEGKQKYALSRLAFYKNNFL